jgi:LacI family transcriptional regulator
MVFLSDTHDDPEHELRVVKAQHLRRVDGIILAPSETGDSETLNYIEANKIPCVLVDRLTSTKFDRVGIQNRHAMGLVVDHLADHGHQRIGFISGQPGFATAIERTEGFRAALSERGLAVDEALIRSGDSIDGAAAAAAELLARPDRPSALAVGNNMSMIGVMRAIRSAGLSVPGDIALVGFDDFEWADCFEPRLTVIAQPVEEIGRKAAELLVRRIAADQSEEPLKPQIIRLKPTLVIRESCGCRA